MCLSLITTYKDIQKANDSIYVSKSSQSFTDLKVISSYNKHYLLDNFLFYFLYKMNIFIAII